MDSKDLGNILLLSHGKSILERDFFQIFILLKRRMMAALYETIRKCDRLHAITSNQIKNVMTEQTV